MKSKILVSACLMGFQVRYNGSQKAQLADALARWQRDGRLVIHCPELAAGLPVPRLPAEILHAQGTDVMQDRARIVESDGQDARPAAASLSTTGRSAGSESRGQAWRRRYCVNTASPFFPTDSYPNSSPGCNREKIAMIHCKRVYDPAEAGDGYRVLVDRLWPRGMKKEALRYDEWCKSLSPSSALRKAFHGEAIDFVSFSQQYREELDARRDEGLRLAGLARQQPLTLLYTAKDTRQNHALVLAEWLENLSAGEATP